MERQKNGQGKIPWKSSLMLFLAAFIWGTAFVAQSVGMDYLGPLSFNGARFLMGSVALLPIICYNRAKKKKEGKKPADFKATATGGVCCGLVLCAAALLQQYGILYTTVGKAGFITTLYIILVPFFGIWNAWFEASIYVPTQKEWWPLQLWIKQMVADNADILSVAQPDWNKYLVSFCVIMIATLPVLIAMPFAQKQLQKGALVGGVKG